jgi:predicted MFS family arabinose efflux permease
VKKASSPEKHKSSSVTKTGKSEWKELLHAHYLAFAAFGILYSIASFGTDGLVTLFLSEVRKIPTESIGWFGTSRGIGALLGAFTYAKLKVSMRKKQGLAILFLAIGCTLPLWLYPSLVLGVVWGSFWAFQETAYVTLAMRFARGTWSATFFSISMIFSNVGTAVGEALAAPLVPQIGYQGIFAAFAILALSSIALVPKMMSKVKD